MPLPIANAPVVPNTIMVPAITVPTRIEADGSLMTSAHIVLKAANVDNDGKWTAIGNESVVFIEDVEAMPEDIAEELVEFDGDTMTLQQLANHAMQCLVTLIGAVNSVRKIV